MRSAPLTRPRHDGTDGYGEEAGRGDREPHGSPLPRKRGRERRATCSSPSLRRRSWRGRNPTPSGAGEGTAGLDKEKQDPTVCRPKLDTLKTQIKE